MIENLRHYQSKKSKVDINILTTNSWDKLKTGAGDGMHTACIAAVDIEQKNLLSPDSTAAVHCFAFLLKPLILPAP